MLIRPYIYKKGLFIPAVIASIFFASLTCSYAQQAANQKSSDTSKNSYFLKKIINNEIQVLKNELASKEKEYQEKFEKEYISVFVSSEDTGKSKELERKLEQLQESSKKDVLRIRELNDQLEKFPQKLKEQKDYYEGLLTEKEKQNALDIKEAAKAPSKVIAIYDKRLAEKDEKIKAAQADEAGKLQKELNKKSQEAESLKNEIILRDKKTEESLIQKDKLFGEEIEKKSRQIEIIREQLSKQEQKFKQFLDNKDKNIEQGQEQLKESRTKANDLSAELVLRQKDINARDLLIKDKDNEIAVLTQKIGQINDRIKEYEKQTERVRELEGESKQLEKELMNVKDSMSQMEDQYVGKIDQQKSVLIDVQKNKEVTLVKTTAEWDKKIKALESKYEKKLQALENQKIKIQEECQRRLEEMSGTIRGKEEENEKLRKTIKTADSDKKQLMEEVLVSKAAGIKGIPRVSGSTPSFKGKSKDLAKVHFDRAMDAIVLQKYDVAKYQIEKVLALQPGDKMAKDILDNLNFLIENSGK
ncbi:MAG: hypothetical protein ABII88_03595 [Candidatus Omnitrophota bacterium]